VIRLIRLNHWVDCGLSGDGSSLVAYTSVGTRPVSQ
jgi:hypothetical protein